MRILFVCSLEDITKSSPTEVGELNLTVKLLQEAVCLLNLVSWAATQVVTWEDNTRPTFVIYEAGGEQIEDSSMLKKLIHEHWRFENEALALNMEFDR